MEFSLLSCRCRLHNFTLDKILNQPLKCLFRLQVANIDTYKEIQQNKKINLQWVINLLRNLNFYTLYYNTCLYGKCIFFIS